MRNAIKKVAVTVFGVVVLVGTAGPAFADPGQGLPTPTNSIDDAAAEAAHRAWQARAAHEACRAGGEAIGVEDAVDLCPDRAESSGPALESSDRGGDGNADSLKGMLGVECDGSLRVPRNGATRHDEEYVDEFGQNVSVSRRALSGGRVGVRTSVTPAPGTSNPVQQFDILETFDASGQRTSYTTVEWHEDLVVIRHHDPETGEAQGGEVQLFDGGEDAAEGGEAEGGETEYGVSPAHGGDYVGTFDDVMCSGAGMTANYLSQLTGENGERLIREAGCTNPVEGAGVEGTSASVAEPNLPEGVPAVRDSDECNGVDPTPERASGMAPPAECGADGTMRGCTTNDTGRPELPQVNPRDVTDPAADPDPLQRAGIETENCGTTATCA